jgi:enoyl-CoA hydratase
MDYETIEFLEDGYVGIIGLNRPERMNAVIEEMYLEIQDVLERARCDESIRALILTGSVLKRGILKRWCTWRQRQS